MPYEIIGIISFVGSLLIAVVFFGEFAKFDISW
jgi:hypothetical protein